MSFDLGVWSEEVRPSRAAASETHRRLCAGESAAVRPAAAVPGFYAALVAEFPEAEDATDELSPWSAGLDVGDGHVLMPMQWGRAAKVAPRVIELAGQHGLVCFDPQAGVVYVPPALRAAGALELQSCVGLPVSDPDLETVERAVRRLSAENWFVILEDPSGWYVQVGTGARAGAAAGGYAVEFRDGSSERHYRCVLHDREQVVSVFVDFTRDPATRPAGVTWEKLTL
ncbi:hypothetical protein [Streptomyces brasiliensis]|uniref:Uncharacterized protein n=1 Tax=Streptomyces brasiliensis TaxID=1954 RepID=A0A917PDS2_9ACTN|nr:hypothetical protein [Streptomyces brasiliensis]GGJ72238.1 hypothetical protein GCM10010121_098530 [Streptomyces brasiliensis]